MLTNNLLQDRSTLLVIAIYYNLVGAPSCAQCAVMALEIETEVVGSYHFRIDHKSTEQIEI